MTPNPPKRMGNPRCAKLFPQDLNDPKALEKFIFPRLLTIAIETECSMADFDQLIADFKVWNAQVEAKRLCAAEAAIRKSLVGLGKSQQVTLLQTLIQEIKS